MSTAKKLLHLNVTIETVSLLYSIRKRFKPTRRSWRLKVKLLQKKVLPRCEKTDICSLSLHVFYVWIRKYCKCFSQRFTKIKFEHDTCTELPASVRGMASSESWTRGSSAAFTSRSGTFTWKSKGHVLTRDTRRGRGNPHRGHLGWWLRAGAYIVNIMYTAFLLVVLFERVVAVKFPSRRQKKAVWAPFKRLGSQDFSTCEGQYKLKTGCRAQTSWWCHQSAWATWLCRVGSDRPLLFSQSFWQTGCACVEQHQ